MPAKGEIEKCDNPCDSNLVLKDAKKERRKPELQRYRPGQGLQNKNLISSKKSDKVDNDTLQCVNNSVKLDDSTKSSKHIKNRRPDIQVYTPKAKAAAKLPGKASTDFCSSKWEDDSVWKNSNSHCDRHNSPEDKSDKHQHIKKENTSVQKNKTPKSDSSKVTASWADCVEEADLLNSHGLPDKCNGYSDNNVHLHLSNSATNSLRSDKSNRPISQKSNKDDYKQKRNKRSNRRNDSYVSISEGNSKESEFENKNWPDTDLSSTKHCDDVNKRNNRMVRESGTSSDEHKGNTNSLDRIKLKHGNSHSSVCSDSKGYTSEYNGYNKFPSEVKCEKKKRDKESTLPPRFQKQKALDANNHRSGGILKIPVEQDPIDSPTEMMNKLHIPKLFPEPPKMFIHKQLFDPNNPSKPEIVNIPAPIPPPHVPYGKINQMYCLTDGLNSPYIPAPVESGVYIPPPQPPVSNPQFRFMQSDMCATNVQNNYVDIRESGASMQCQIPQMNNIFSSTSHAYVDMPPDSGKKRLDLHSSSKFDAYIANANSVPAVIALMNVQYKSRITNSAAVISSSNLNNEMSQGQDYGSGFKNTPSLFENTACPISPLKIIKCGCKSYNFVDSGHYIPPKPLEINSGCNSSVCIKNGLCLPPSEPLKVHVDSGYSSPMLPSKLSPDPASTESPENFASKQEVNPLASPSYLEDMFADYFSPEYKNPNDVEDDYVAHLIGSCTSEVPTDHLIMYDYSKKRIKPLVERNLYDIVLIEKELSSALSKSLLEIDLDNLNKIRYKLQLRYENIILADPKYCAEKNPEQSLWKTSYHQIIEAFRKKLEEDQKNSEKIKETLFKLIIEGTVFYENLLEKQQEAYGFKLTKLLDVEHINTSGFSDQMRIVLISVQKHLIYLGDLARYKEQISQTSNYGKARSWYLKAQKIAPKNGKPYHQLALLAFNTKRKLDAVYYYMRSLAASNPFLSAKESLLSLFEEAKIKYEIYEKKRTKESSVETEILENQTAERTEVWIKNDGSSSQLPAEAEKSNAGCELKKLSDVEINKRFITSFLHVHGKLFTKVGMDTFPDALKNMLTEFYFLLQRSPIPLTSVRLLQLLAINIFSVTNSSLKENGREHGGESLLQEQALYTSMAMMSLMMDRCCLLQVAHKSSSDHSTQLIADDFVTLLPSIKTWTDWMSCQKCLWPPPSLRILENAQSNNIWTSFAAFLSVLQDIDTAKVEILTEPCPNSEPIILDEDKLFAGFVPVLGAIQVPSFAVQPFDKITAKHCARISKIQFFGDYLCGICPPYLKFDVTFKRFVALVNFSFKETSERSVLLSSDESFGEVQLNDELNDAAVSRNSLSNEFQVLKSRKEALSRAREQQQKYQAQVQAVLHEHQNQRLVLLKIKPRVLVPDTNCFVDHLKLFKNILASTDFHLVIPLVVINELDGLARGTRVNDHTSSGHASRVTVLAREAVTFLEEQFALRHPHLRSITSKGSTLDTISFRSEEISQNKGTNDDLILSCCLNYCKDRAENYMPKTRDEPITLFREVVLLTDDRNLRIKALAHHVPVRDLLSFLQWANA